MACTTRLMLRLPSGLRQHILDPSRLRLNVAATRTYAKKGKSPPPPPKPFDNLNTTAEPPLSKVKPAKPSPSKPDKSTPDVTPDVEPDPIAKQSTILLYTAPSHGVFYVWSYLAGGFFILGAYTYSELVLKDLPDGTRQPWWKKSIGAVSALAAASFGTLFILGPMGLIKSVSIVTTEINFANATAKFTRAPRTLRIEVKRKLPFLKPDILETDIANVTLDRRVPVALQDLNFRSIPKASSESWTAAYLKGAAEPEKMGGVTAAIKGIWPAIRREVRRMFLRDQIAYVHVKGNGNFKLDLQGCRMLEGGQALDRVLADDPSMNKSFMKWLHNLIEG